MDKYEFPNNSLYRGQMKRIDEATRQKYCESEDTSSYNSKDMFQNRLSSKSEHQGDMQTDS